MELRITNPGKHFSKPAALEQNQQSRFSEAEKSKLAKASKDFESLLTSMMLKSMTKTSGGMFGEDSFGGDFFETIFESQLASHITESKGMGIAEKLYEQLTGESFDDIKGKFLNRIDPLENRIKIKNSEIDNSLKSIPSGEVVPSRQSINRVNQYEEYINEASKIYGVDEALIKSVILTESAGNVKAVSSAKAKGLMQLIDSTAKKMGVNDVWNPRENILGGTKYLSQMLRKYEGDVKLALASYNAGPGNVDKYNGIPPFDETKSYVSRVLGYFNHFNGSEDWKLNI